MIDEEELRRRKDAAQKQHYSDQRAHEAAYDRGETSLHESSPVPNMTKNYIDYMRLNAVSTAFSHYKTAKWKLELEIKRTDYKG